MALPYTLLHDGPLDTLREALLRERGLSTESEQAAFLEPDYTTLHAPELLHTMDAAVSRIAAAMLASEPIVIFSDYDCDGIPGAVVLHDFFTAIGYPHFSNVIPHRHYEGFGLSVSAVEKIAKTGARLIVTIDCGTNDEAAILRATELGVDVIVTDHHEPGETLPAAVAIVNPKLGDYPFPHLCGAGVVYKLVQALINTGAYTILPGQEKWWLDMVGVATIADMVPLVGENRIFAHYGLTVLRKSRRPGLQQLLRKARIPQAYLTEEDIGFTIGPRVNAASRMDAPEHAFHLLTTKDEGEAGGYVERLEHLNNERKGAVATMTREVHGRLKEMTDMPAVLVMGNPLWRPALVGLTANKLAEEYKRPVFLWGRDGNDVIKGSCRSGGGVSVVRLMEAVPDIFHEYGGHHASGGFAVHDEHIHTFGDFLNEAFVRLGSEALVVEPLRVDAVLTLDEVNGPVRQLLGQLAPFGTGNSKPLFAFSTVVPDTVAAFGKAKEHLKLTFTTNRGPLEAIAFFATPADFTTAPNEGQSCTLVAHIEESFFMGRRSTRLRIVDII
ncbi:MAG: single-stranded-DNA-specific exonuclease, single-stranded-DNA-specific exonuclease [Candidatus Parcubacteria bacterium]|jgi:single-stranded-DNA-specific exonuclease